MSKIKRGLTSSINPMVETKNTTEIKSKTGNLYESIAVIAKRANQINISVKEELHSKLEEFASHTDNLEEVHENKEQIEISRFYERMANPAIQATMEFLEDKIYFRRNDDDLYS
ncbi:RNA polymerase Rpb6 [Chitinophaga sp. YR627]|jgi:DNA-directed RNA polymerase subunit K/omega|uniref:DNA-directed RNA polymerase, omega subunit n=3 Tax=Chitinophaga TaxID=79328 RepID=A0A979GX15_CHIPD|nr:MULTISPECIES: DNA-directed RNA polymerase subunit omega [Chitinophaga]ACU64368.1 DNA-directed RNA polymerase, omega subunit [Chitinophaga pinensis DSM 2588]TWW02087.1 DNA-directed RNA polymerase subunit omega [Chitinophaga pinensis]SDE89532.1 RNA polymerase Rpb6 [Chitinophaga filiformis]SFO17112.1 RNA polymerase Rpb6 [Chitinophaga sp. YR627]